MDPSNPFAPNHRVSLADTLVDREAELAMLARQLFDLQRRVVSITGPPGIGKTSLALMFAHLHEDEFPGGVTSLRAIPGVPLSQLAVHAVPEDDQKRLVIVDDLERLPDEAIEGELRDLLAARPRTKVILASRRAMGLPSGTTAVRLGPLTAQEMEQYLRLLGCDLRKTEVEQLYTLSGGLPLVIRLVAGVLEGASLTMAQVLDRLTPFSKPGLLGPDGRPLTAGSESYRHVVTDVTSVSDDLLKKLADDPGLLYQLSPRLFEEVVGELLTRLGYEVSLTPASRDGGKDIYVATRNELGSFLYIVECKKYAADNPVGVGLVRQLHGVVQAEQATAGILATTSFFTRGAKEFQRQVAFQISLQDYLGIQEWLRSSQLWKSH